MLLAKQAGSNESSTDSQRGLTLLIEPEPWLRIFLRNFSDLFRATPPPVWISARPGEYWADAQVNRPVAWAAVRQSVLVHILLFVSIYALDVLWQSKPQVLPEATGPKAVLHYELSEYLPAVNPRQSRPETPRRKRPQKADPELASQEIVVLNEHHASTRQTIVQPSPVFLKQDVPLPNLVASTPVPGAPTAMNHPLQVLPVNVPQVAAPAESVQSNMRPLLFPPAAQPVVAAPAGAIAANRQPIPAIPLPGSIVVPPAPDTATRKADGLQLPAQAPPQVAAPAEEIAGGHAVQQLPMAAPQVAPPSEATASRNLSALGLPAQAPNAAPPASPVVSGSNTHEKEIGQLLALNARPIAPNGPITVPEGNRAGEFAASPSGHSGASARPEIKAGDTDSKPGKSGGGASPDIYVSAPPTKVTGNTVAGAPRASRPLQPDRAGTLPREAVEARVFGTRKHYSMRLSMPNLTSSVGSWSVRFAELNPSGHGEADISAPEAITKVDPAYPQELRQDRIEGTVVLRAVIRSDGSVADVRVLEGFDQRLDENARKALEQWRFRPGTKDGEPVDIEAVVRVPFKVPRNSF